MIWTKIQSKNQERLITNSLPIIKKCQILQKRNLPNLSPLKELHPLDNLGRLFKMTPSNSNYDTVLMTQKLHLSKKFRPRDSIQTKCSSMVSVSTSLMIGRNPWESGTWTVRLKIRNNSSAFWDHLKVSKCSASQAKGRLFMSKTSSSTSNRWSCTLPT